MSRTLGFVTAVACTLLPLMAHALPAEISESAEDDDASVTLTMLDQTIVSDPLVWCSLEVAVGSTAVGWTEGDTITVSVYEDDPVGNDLVWTDEHVISAEEAAEETFEATFNCGAAGMDDGFGSSVEFFAELAVDKAACTGLCNQDDPTTSNLDVLVVEDDDAEEDDDTTMARPATLDLLHERIAADPDYMRVTMANSGSLEATLDFMPECGEVAVSVVDDRGRVLAEGEADADGATVVAEVSAPGAYFVVSGPADAGDFNFYDIEVRTELDPDGGGTGDTGGNDGGTGSDDDDDDDDDGAPGDDDDDDDDDDGGSPGDDDDDDDVDGGSDESGLPSGGAADGEDGCGCTHGAPAPLGLAGLVLLGLLRRRRR